jgi:hypothetical protein
MTRPMLSLAREDRGSQAMIIPGAVFGDIQKVARSGKQLAVRRARAEARVDQSNRTLPEQ